MFLWFCSRTKRFYIHPNPNPNPNHNPEAIHNPNHNPNPNPSPKQSNSCLTSLSRDQNSSLPITLQESIFTLRHGGIIRNHHPKIHRSRSIIHPKGLFTRIFLKFGRAIQKERKICHPHKNLTQSVSFYGMRKHRLPVFQHLLRHK